jgi:PAS domain S-box-containing protein
MSNTTEKTRKLIALFSLLVSTIVILLYFLFDLSVSSIYYHSNLKLALFSAFLVCFYSLLYLILYKYNSDTSFGILLLLNSILSLFILDYLGGPLSEYVFFIYIIIALGFVIDYFWGIVISALVLIYILAVFYLQDFNKTPTFLIILTSTMVFSFIMAKISKSFLNSLNDKNEHERADNESDTSLSKETAILSNIADGVYAIDTERNITMLNAAAEKITGWTAEEAIGLKCWTIMNFKDQQDTSVCQKDCPALNVWTSGKTIMRDDTCLLKHKASRSIQVSSSYSPIKDKNDIIKGAICIFQDITKKKEAERLKSEFVSTASHELRTPITAIEGYLSIIENEKICKIDEKAVEYSKKAHEIALGMANLIQNLLMVTRLEEGKVKTEITNFSIYELVKESLENLQVSASKKNLYLKIVENSDQNISFEKTLGRSLNVTADREQLREVIYNLVENSLKFTSEGGVSVSISYDKDTATVCIADTGIGIPTDAQKHLFEKFYRVDNTATRETGGTGLGLFITRTIIESFGGKIWLESQLGKGTKFFFTTPLSLE